MGLTWLTEPDDNDSICGACGGQLTAFSDTFALVTCSECGRPHFWDKTAGTFLPEGEFKRLEIEDILMKVNR